MNSRAMSSTSNPVIAWVGVAAVVAAVGLGMAAGAFGVPTIAAMLAVVAAFAVLWNPMIGVLILVATLPVENLLVVGGFTFSRLIGLAVFGAWLVGKVAKRESWQAVLSTGFFVAVAGFACLIMLSMLWAEHRTSTWRGFISVAQMVMLALIVIDLGSTHRRLDAIARVLVVSASVAALLTISQFQSDALHRAGEDIAGGVNATSVLLMTTIPLGFYLIRRRGSAFWRLIGFLFIPLAATAVVVTFSRFNLMLMPPLLAVMVVLTLRDRQSRGWVMMMAAALAIGATVLVPWDRIRERAETISPYLMDTLQFGRSQTATSSRGYHLRVGLAIARDNPVLGVGYGNYGHYFLNEYQYQVSGADRLYRSVRSPHSSYIGIAADLGAVGLIAWIALLGTCVAAVWRAWKTHRGGDPSLVALIESLAVMLAMHILAYGWYMPHQREKLFWVILGMCVAVGLLALPGPHEVEAEPH